MDYHSQLIVSSSLSSLSCESTRCTGAEKERNGNCFSLRNWSFQVTQRQEEFARQERNILPSSRLSFLIKHKFLSWQYVQDGSQHEKSLGNLKIIKKFFTLLVAYLRVCLTSLHEKNAKATEESEKQKVKFEFSPKGK